MAEEDALKRKAEEEQGKRKKIEVKDFLLMQMGGAPTAVPNYQNATDSSGFINLPQPGKKVGVAMNIEELRINK